MAAVVAQFILSPDLIFSEKGTVSGINYHDHFTQYKKFIVRHLEMLQMKELMAQLNMELFKNKIVDDQLSSPEVEAAADDEDDFAQAFSNKTVQPNPLDTLAVNSPASTTGPPDLPTTPLEPLAATPNQDHLVAVPPTNSSDVLAVDNDNEPETTTNRRCSTQGKKGKGKK